ncbi:MAG: E3 ubiquitin-protein ligase SspH1 [Chlamydiae bacterium]|nr:E3 ubiquitin-protein ligase SspH1 [Chlamydiota bacterium]
MEIDHSNLAEGTLGYPDEILLPVLQLLSIEERGTLAPECKRLWSICNDYSFWSIFARAHGISIEKVIAKEGQNTVGDMQMASQRQIPGMVIDAVRKEIQSMPDCSKKTKLLNRLERPIILSALKGMLKFVDAFVVYQKLAETASLSPIDEKYLKNHETLETWLLTNLNELVKIEKLDLKDNQLTELPELVGCLTALQMIGLNGNRLTKLPESFGSLTALQSLGLGNNQLTALQESFGSLSALQKLDLYDNQLAALPESFGSLTALVELRLTNNQLTKLPGSFGNLTALQKLLLLPNDQLTILPQLFKGLVNLKRPR